MYLLINSFHYAIETSHLIKSKNLNTPERQKPKQFICSVFTLIYAMSSGRKRNAPTFVASLLMRICVACLASPSHVVLQVLPADTRRQVLNKNPVVGASWWSIPTAALVRIIVPAAAAPRRPTLKTPSSHHTQRFKRKNITMRSREE